MQRGNAQQPGSIFLISDRFRTQEICIEGVAENPRELHNVPDHFKTQEMCDKAVTFNPYTLRFVLITLRPKKCVMPQWGKTWFFDIYPRFVCDTTTSKIMAWWRWFLWWWWDYWVVRRLSKTQGKKAQIEKELMHNAWYPLRWWDWSMSEMKKNRQKKCGSSCFKISDMLRLKRY